MKLKIFFSLVQARGGHRDCQIRADWILIYRVSAATITFERTGTHSDLFE